MVSRAQWTSYFFCSLEAQYVSAAKWSRIDLDGQQSLPFLLAGWINFVGHGTKSHNRKDRAGLRRWTIKRSIP